MAIHGFELLQERHIPELNSRARLFRHVATGAELLSVENDDENKVFGITFRTPPSDSTGVAHILEHTVLCGSRKYPLKDPFVELIKGSLKTFVNAMTYPDKTCYPVASQNTRDFYNLIDVYVDAVLFPRLAPHHFEQEAWHYELESADAPLIYKGVVFNEMKGAYSSPEGVLGEQSQQSLFPDNTYGVDSGGNPRNIPDLTYEQLREFHRTYYHPSNSRIFFYGDDEPEERLRLMASYLRDFEPIAIDSQVALQQPFDRPRQVRRTYPASADEARTDRAMLTVNWMLGQSPDIETTLGLGILEYVLLGTTASPLRKALIDSGLGENITGAGLVDGLRQIYFSTGLKNFDPDNAEAVEGLILRTLEQLAGGAIDPQTIAAAMNTVEFALRENNTGSFPRGLSLMLRALDGWIHGGDPIEHLAFEAPLAAVKQRVQAEGPAYFGGLIQRYLIDNPHRTTVLLLPDRQQAEREAAEERARLDQVQTTLSQAEVQQIVENTRQLKLLQETPDAPEVRATIPSLKLADLDRHNKTIPIETTERGQVRTLYHDLFTNGIVYLDLGLDLHTLPQELLPYVPLFGRSLLELGTEQEDFVRLSQRIGRTTGGIRTQRLLSTRRGGAGSVAWLFLRGKAMPEQAGDLLAIMRDVLLTVQLNNQERFRQLVLEEKARLESGLAPSGHMFADTRLRSRFTEADWAAEQMGGVSYLFFLRQLAQDVDTRWRAVLERLEQVRRTLVNRQAMLCNVTTDAANWREVAPRLDEALAELPSAEATTSHWTRATGQAGEGLTIPAQVNYVAKGADLFKLGYGAHGSTAVISNYLRTSWLWEQIRVRGGAYGGFCRYDRNSGVFSFLSYRDPNLLKTLDVYDRTSQFLRQVSLNETERTRSIIGVISDIDSYELPDAKGYTSMMRHLIGDTDELRQQMRDEVLATTEDNFHAFADALEQVRASGQVVALGGQSAIDAANAERPGLLEVVKVL